MKGEKFLAVALAGIFSSCQSLPRSAAKSGFDFSKINTVEVMTDKKLSAFVSKELLVQGISAVSSETLKEAEGILKVTVNREAPEKKYLIRPRKTQHQTVLAQASPPAATSVITFIEEEGHPPVEVVGGFPYVSSALAGTGGETLVSSFAQVVLSGELIHGPTGDILWAGSYTYEGLDLETALEGAVRGLIQGIPWGRR